MAPQFPHLSQRLPYDFKPAESQTTVNTAKVNTGSANVMKNIAAITPVKIKGNTIMTNIFPP
jgi:NAD-dependent DNA ligase